MTMKSFTRGILPVILAAMVQMNANAQMLSLEECRRMAVENNRELEQARTAIEMSEYDRKIARAAYTPDISVKGTYMYNNQGIALIGDEQSERLRNMGTAVQGQVQGFTQSLMGAIQSNPQALAEYMKSPMWQTVLGSLSQADMSEALNAIGQEVDDALHPDIEHVVAGGVFLMQPVFAGGKIVASNRIARLAEELSCSKYDQKYQEVLTTVEQTYWQVVSLAGKKRLAESYSDLLHKMERDVELSVEEGVSTKSDLLQVRVKANEADMLKTKAENGLALSKMLLCKQIGLDLDSSIMLADEESGEIESAPKDSGKSMEDIFRDRPEIRSLGTAVQIYDSKVKVARADMMPTVALTAGYLVTNPNLKNGFQKDWGGFLSAGVAVSVPIFHGFEAANKTRKAKAEAALYRSQLQDAKEMVTLQVSQLRKQEAEAAEKLGMARANLDCAEENLRTATVGFAEGVIDANTALAAQTAWLQAHSEYIDSGIELRMLGTSLNMAEGNDLPESR